MYRKILVTLSAVTFLLGVSKLSFAQAHTEHEHGVAETSKEVVPEEAMGVGNKICPVSGDKIDQNLKVTYEYEGKIYNFCCASCVEEFKKDPQKYIKKVKEELQAEPKEGMAKEKETMPEGETMQGMHEGHQHSR